MGGGGSSKCVQMRAWEGGGVEALRAHGPRTLEFAHVVHAHFEQNLHLWALPYTA